MINPLNAITKPVQDIRSFIPSLRKPHHGQPVDQSSEHDSYFGPLNRVLQMPRMQNQFSPLGNFDSYQPLQRATGLSVVNNPYMQPGITRPSEDDVTQLDTLQPVGYNGRQVSLHGMFMQGGLPPGFNPYRRIGF